MDENIRQHNTRIGNNRNLRASLAWRSGPKFPSLRGGGKPSFLRAIMNGQPTTEKKERSRSKAACQFCRTRKLKCDNLEPECSACRSRSIECVYVQRVAAPRPSNAAIQALQAENRRLRRLLEAHRIDVNEGVLSPDDGSSQMASPIDGRVAAMGAQREEHMRDVGMCTFSTLMIVLQWLHQLFSAMRNMDIPWNNGVASSISDFSIQTIPQSICPCTNLSLCNSLEWRLKSVNL